MVGIRLVSPRFGQSPLSLLPGEGTALQAALDAPLFRIPSNVTAFNIPTNTSLPAPIYESAVQPAGRTWSFASICAIVWIAGMVLIALWALASFLRLRRQVADAVPVGDGVWLSDRINSPFLLGLFRPRIYLPVGLDEASREYVLAHERAHLRRHDHLIKPLGLLLLTVYWFQPLAWVAYILLCRDIELACDERVVLELGDECKKPYSTALLECSVHRGVIAACPLAFGEVGVKERVKNVLNYKKPTFWMFLACIAVLAVVAVCFLTDPVSAKEPEKDVPFYYQGVNQPEEAEVFAVGALLYQNPYLGFMPLDGGSYNPVLYGGDTLAITQDYPGLPITYKLAETIGMNWDNLYDYIPDLKESEELFDAFLTEHNDLVITVRFYEKDRSNSASDTDAPQDRPSVWTIQKENGGGQQWWLMIGGRIYALIYLEEAFPFLANGALWTYMPASSTELPVRFDMEGGADVYAGAGGRLRLHPVEGEWVDHLEVEAGQTVYWKPPLNDNGQPIEGTGLHYFYDAALQGKDGRWDEWLAIRPAMGYTSMYGGRTYGVSNNWLGAASSAIHLTALTVDAETGALVVGTFQDSGSSPYKTRWGEESVGSVFGTTEPGGAVDAPAEPRKEQLTLEKLKKLAKKGEDLTWSDLEQYKDEGDIGSGLHILLYDIDECCYLLIGGGGTDTPPMYIYLISKADDRIRIDIRTESIDDFINSLSE